METAAPPRRKAAARDGHGNAAVDGRATPALSRRENAAFFLVAAAVRLAAAAEVGLRRWRFGDGVAYARAAGALWTTGRYPDHTDLLLFRPPGYPAFLAISTLGHPAAVVWDKVVNVLLGSAAVLVLAAVAGRLFGSRRATRASALLAAIHPGFVVLSTDVQSEPLYLLLLIAAGFLLIVSVDRPSSGCALGAGAALALAALTRPAAIAYVPLLAAPVFDRRFPAAVRRAIAGSAFFGFAVFLLPWTVRNAVRFHALLPVSDGGGMVLYQGNSDWAVRYYAARTPAERQRWGDDFNLGLAVWARTVPGLSDSNPAVRSRALRDAAIEWVRAHPAAEGRLVVAKLGHWLRPGADPGEWGSAAALGTSAWTIAVTALAVIGWWNARRRGARAVAAAAMAIALLVHLATIVAVRYRFVSWDPVIVLYAASGIEKLAGRV